MRARSLPAGVIVLATLILLLGSAGLFAETKSSVTISSYTSLLYSGDLEDPVKVAALLKSSLNVDSVGNKNVKGYFQLDSWIAESFGFDIPRAYLKVRFPGFRLTLGKTRVSWGEGFVFNAGDVLFGSMGAISGDLSGESLRAETGWLGVLYVPVGSFSFLEAVLAPYSLPAPIGTLQTDFSFLADTVSLDQLSGGARGVFKLGRTTLETGYYASGTEAEHRPYISTHGYLLVDWTLSASMTIPMFDPQWQKWHEWLAISASVFRQLKLGPDRDLTFRLEAAIRPGALWQEASGAEAIQAGLPGAPEYGLYLFPEVALPLSDTLSLQLRSLISPVDLSALSMVSVSWNVYQGLHIYNYLSLMNGDGDDLYGTDRLGGVGWTVGLEFIY